MKKILRLLAIAFTLTGTSNAQVIVDTVSIGAGYANQKWYSLQNDDQRDQPKNNWDISFDCSGFGSSIHINSITGTLLWKYPSADTAGWTGLDTAGISGWPKLYNSDKVWATGAFDRNRNSGNPYDLGWGIYSSITHIVTGDSLYVIKLSDGIYKKIWVQSLSGGAYNFQYANIDGTDPHSVSFEKSSYADKNFGYYSLETNEALDREPTSESWDLLFTQYTTFIPDAYTVSGILSNNGVSIARVNNVGNVATFNDWNSQIFTTHINAIGYDWKSFTGSGYEVTDSLVYFVKTAAGDLWKIVPLGFGGSSSGNYVFSKEKLSATAIKNEIGNPSLILSIYPNPSNGAPVDIICNTTSKTILTISDLSGRVVVSERLTNDSGLNVFRMETTGMNSGMYIVSVEAGGKKLQNKLIIQ